MAETNSGVQSIFTQHHNEIRRRSTVVHDKGTLNSKGFTHVECDGLDDPFVNSEQRFIVFSLSQQEFAPVPTEPSNPALCIYGAFQTRDDAIDHANMIYLKQPSVSVLVDETHKWIVAPTTVAHMMDETYVEQHRSRLLKGVEDALKHNTAEFHENVDNQRVGRLNNDAETEKADDAPVEVSQNSQRIHRDCRVPDQRLAVMSVIKDDAEVPEFLFRVYACYDTDVEANKYVCNVCGDAVTNVDIDVVKTCSWVFPQKMNGVHAQREVYRSPELHNVMQCHKKNPRDVEKFYRDHDISPDWEPAHAATDDAAVSAEIQPTSGSDHESSVPADEEGESQETVI